MFHILIENSNPDRLVGGPWKSVRTFLSDTVASVVECGLKGGQIREAIPHQRYKTLSSNGKLNTERACKQCLRRAGGKHRG
jgi:hypothetical protein